MNVIKRNGTIEEVNFEKIVKRIKFLVNEPTPLKNINVHYLAQNVIHGVHDGIHTTEIDTYAANMSASLSIKNYENAILAGRIAVNNHHKNTLTSFKDKMDKLYLRKDCHGVASPIINISFYKFVKKNQVAIESYIDYSRDYLLDFFAFKTLEKSYLLCIDDEIVERPQDLFMRSAIAIHHSRSGYPLGVDSLPSNLTKIFETYDLLSHKYFTHATPTLFNAGLVKPALVSCMLLGTEDSLEGICKTVKDAALLSKHSSGIGIHVSNWRSAGALIRGTGGTSSGIVPFLRLLNDTARAFNQGGRRLGSFAIYLEPHHPDIMAFLQLRRASGDENLRARDLFLALWISDLFMERVRDNQSWSTFDPDECPGLTDVFGDEYVKLYEQYEAQGKARNVYKARDIWKAVFESQKESGMPYLSYKDIANTASNQKNIGIIKSSNLCNEIYEVSTSDEYANCVLSSICLSKFVDHNGGETVFDYKKFQDVINVVVYNLNRVIDINYYPMPEAKRSNMRHRPIAVGVQGLSDVFFKFKIPFDSEQARTLNKYIFQTLYYTAVSASSKQAREIYLEYRNECLLRGKVTVPVITDTGKLTKVEYTSVEDLPTTSGAYSTFVGSPLSKGIFHFEMYGETAPDGFDWESLRAHVMKFGTRNSLLIALMPTASTSQIMGNIECIEPLTSNIFKRQTLAGEFIVVNKYLMDDLHDLGLWDDTMENWIKYNNGSIQNIEGIPTHIKNLYKTVWEISQKALIDLAADRQPYVDQSQSLNLFVEDLTFSKFNSMHFYGWQRKLKTGCYYLRSRAATTGQKFTVDETKLLDRISSEYTEPQIVGPDSVCEVCSG